MQIHIHNQKRSNRVHALVLMLYLTGYLDSHLGKAMFFLVIIQFLCHLNYSNGAPVCSEKFHSFSSSICLPGSHLKKLTGQNGEKNKLFLLLF